MASSDEPTLTRVIAIRHGETAWNADARMQGHLDIPLNETGRWQARRLAAVLADAGIDVIYTSDLSRARETAEIVAAAAGCPLRVDAALRERCFGVFEGHAFREIEARWPDDAARWLRRDTDFAPSGAETLVDFCARTTGAATRIAAAHAGQTIAIVAHGGVLDCLYRAATRVDLQAARSWQLGNAAINRLLHTAQGFTLVGWGDVQHLDAPALDESNDGSALARPGQQVRAAGGR
ncbi:histidine phosphatase family protein [Piscinibacter koreensis]|uniref:Histidine phosphatase family protein n=1 Tax=Piscinibacter koreensis TaxID=2742824 RepID=A0A7Y6NKK7_9BURK|nr:histidine phosphatase family protein [Schlegelella koreensis]NUZ04860.1 histidine phosphatase family protein [Schlegelella koreensis]